MDSVHLANGKCPQCGPVRRYKNTVRDNLKRCGIHPQSLVSAPHDRGQWRSTCRTAIAAFKEARVASLQRKRAARKHQVVSSTNMAWPCDRCNKVCSSRIMGSLPIVLPIDEAVRRTRRCSPCECIVAEQIELVSYVSITTEHSYLVS